MNRPDFPLVPFAEATGRGPGDVALVGLFVLALLVALHVAAAIVVPMTAAIIFGSVLAHIGDRAQKIGVPPLAGGLALVAATGVGLFFLIDAAAEAVAGLGGRLPDMANRVEALFGRLTAPLVSLRSHLVGGGSIVDAQSADGGLGKFASSIDLGAISGLLGGLTPALGEVLIFFATLAFFVVGRAALRRQTILAFADREARLSAIRVINAMEAAMAIYFGTTASVYLGVGMVTALIAWAGGLTNPALWGVVAFLLSFVPFLGPALIAFALLSTGLLVHDVSLGAVWPAGAFVLVHLAAENGVIPSILGRRFEINPFLVFVAIVFWTWMWGAMGAVLAMPLVLVLRTLQDELRSDVGGTLPD